MSKTGHIHGVLMGITLLGLGGCARDVQQSTPVDPESVVVAQFDPTHAIPVLQLVSSPTGLAQIRDETTGELTHRLPNTLRKSEGGVLPEPCELPTASQCLRYVDGWPTSAKPTLYFSGDLDESTITSGIRLYELNAGGVRELSYDYTVEARPAVNVLCQDGDNGSDPPRTYKPEDVPTGIQVILTPNQSFSAATKYFVLVSSNEAGGLRSADGQQVEPSSLFSILNIDPATDVDQEPVAVDGNIRSGLLRSQAKSTILNNLFAGRPLSDLTDDEQTRFDQALAATGLRLRGVFVFFNEVVKTLMNDALFAGGEAPLSSFQDAIFVNHWSTGPEPATQIAFDPQNEVLPYPNAELFTRPDPDVPGGFRVAIPSSFTDTESTRRLKLALNTLNGFSTTASISVMTTRDIDASTLVGNVHMYVLDEQGAYGDAVAIDVSFNPETDVAPPTIMIRPQSPLAEESTYVLGIVSPASAPILDLDAEPVQRSATFELLSFGDPFIDEQGTVHSDKLTELQCVPLAQGQDGLADSATLIGIASQLEFQEFNNEPGLAHQRWLNAIGLIADAAAVNSDEVLLAWTHKTQSITRDISEFRTDKLVPAGWETLLPGPRVIGPVVELPSQASIIGAMDVVGNYCVPACLAGATAPISPLDCMQQDAPNPGLDGHPVCQALKGIAASHLGSARLYLLNGYRLTDGSPFGSGVFTSTTVDTPDIVNIPFWVVTGTTTPASGHRVAVFQHPIGTSKEAGFLVANTLARTGAFATVMMDLPYHGDRASDLVSNDTGIPCTDTDRNPNIDPADVTCSSTTTACNGCDQIRDSSGTGFLSPSPFGTRDNLRQATVDILTLIRAIQEESDAGEALEALDGTSISYFGASLGGTAGANLIAYLDSAEINAVVLGGAGGGLIHNFLLKTVPEISGSLFLSLNALGVCQYLDPLDLDKGCKDSAALRQFMNTAQWVIDPGDPLANAPAVDAALVADKLLLMMATPDPLLPNIATTALADAYGIPDADPRLQSYDFSTFAASERGVGCHGFVISPFNTKEGDVPLPCGECLGDALCRTIVAQEQVATFLDSGGATITDTTLPIDVQGIPCACQ